MCYLNILWPFIANLQLRKGSPALPTHNSLLGKMWSHRQFGPRDRFNQYLVWKKGLSLYCLKVPRWFYCGPVRETWIKDNQKPRIPCFPPFSYRSLNPLHFKWSWYSAPCPADFSLLNVMTNLFYIFKASLGYWPANYISQFIIKH